MNNTLLGVLKALNSRTFKTPPPSLVTACVKVQSLTFDVQKFIPVTLSLQLEGKEGSTFACTNTAAIHGYNHVCKELKRLVTSISNEDPTPLATFLKEVASKPISVTYFVHDDVSSPTMEPADRPPPLVLPREPLNFQEPVRALDQFGPMEELAPLGAGGLMFPQD